MNEAITVELISQLGAALVACIAVAASWVGVKRKSKIEHLQNELQVKSQVLSMSRFAAEWVHVDQELQQIVAETEVDYIFLSVAWNGRYAPEYLTVTHQYTGPTDPMLRIVDAQTDDFFKDFINDIERKGNKTIIRDQIPVGTLQRRIYDVNGLPHGEAIFIGAIDHAGGSREIDYAVFFTRSDKPLSPKTKLRATMAIHRIRALIMVPGRVFH